MRWLTFILLAILALCIQTTLAPCLGIRGTYPDFIMVLLVHYALHARGHSGLISGWILGLLVSLYTVETHGVVMLVYGLGGAAIWSVRELTFTRHLSTHFCATAAGTLLVHFVLRSYHQMTGGDGATLVQSLWVSLGDGIYTGLWAIPLQRLLIRCSRTLGLHHTGKEPWSGPSLARTARVV